MKQDLTPLVDLYAEVSLWVVQAARETKDAVLAEAASDYAIEDTEVRIAAAARLEAFRATLRAVEAAVDAILG